MAIFNFFGNSTKHLAETIQSVNLRINEHNEYMSEQLGEINERLRRIEIMHKETSLQIEEIDSNLQGDGDEAIFVSALIALADIVEDFYYFAAEDKGSSNQGSLNQGLSNQGSALFEQALMMWNSAKNRLEAAGLTIIDTTDEPFDFNIHSIKGTAWDDNLPAGYVIKTIKCGYIFKDEIIRQAAVIVNKQEINKEGIIYL